MTVKREREGKNMTLVYCDKQGRLLSVNDVS